MAGKALALFYLAYDREPPVGKEKTAKIGTWATALKNIPVERILPLAEAELAERDSPFLPAPADLIRRFNASRIMTPEGAANVACYQPFVPTKALPAPLPPLQIEPAELKRRLGTPVHSPWRESDAKKSPDPLDTPSLRESWSGLLADVARAGNIDLDRCTPQQIVDLRLFGQWWLMAHPHDDLGQYGFVAGYSEFCESKRQREAA